MDEISNRCPKCGCEVSSKSQFCPKCGARLSQQTISAAVVGAAQPKEKKPRRQLTEKAKKTIKVISISASAVIVVALVASILGALAGNIWIPKSKYNKAMSLLETDPEKAAEIFGSIDWEDSYKQLCFAKARAKFRDGKIEQGINDMKSGNGYVFSSIDSFDIDYCRNSEPLDSTGYTLTDYKFYEKNTRVKLYFDINEYNLSLTSDDLGTVSGFGTFAYNSTVTISAVAKQKDRTKFLGWFDGETLVSNESKYVFNMPAHNISYSARFSYFAYEVNLTVNDKSLGSVSGDGLYEIGSTVTLKAYTPVTTFDDRRAFTFLGWFEDGILVSRQETLTFGMPERPLNYEARFSAEATTLDVGDCVGYGSFPKTLVRDSSIISALEDEFSITSKIPTKDDYKGWTLFNWKIEGEDRMAWYLDLDLNHDSKYDYREVAFSYEKAWHNADGESFSGHFIYTFKYEPIVWEIVSIYSNNYKLMAKDVVDLQIFADYVAHGVNGDPENSYTERTDYNGETDSVTINNYKYSDIRTFLNTTFLNSAFSSQEKGKMLTYEVNNGGSASINEYHNCENTFDKVSIPSDGEAAVETEEAPYGGEIEGTALEKIATEYCMCVGMSNREYVSWWTRTPFHRYSYYVRDVTGTSIYWGSWANSRKGVVPVIMVDLSL